jgi:plasmid replication initiation protein
MNKRNIIKQDYKLVNGKYKLDVNEIKFIFAVISQIKIEDKEFKTYEISVSELEDRLQAKQNETRLKQFAKKLMSKPFEVQTLTGWTVYNWFSKIEYVRNSGKFVVRIDDDLKPYLLELNERIVKTNFKEIINFSSTYAIRIYQMLIEYQKIGSRTFNVVELQDTLQVPPSLKTYSNFKLKVLDVAVKEINRNTSLYIELTESKKERKKVIEITFKIQSANKAMTTEILQSYIGRDIQIKGEITKITEAYAEDGNIYIFVMLKGDSTTPKKTLVSIDTKDKFFHALEMAERQGKLF